MKIWMYCNMWVKILWYITSLSFSYIYIYIYWFLGKEMSNQSNKIWIFIQRTKILNVFLFLIVDSNDWRSVFNVEVNTFIVCWPVSCLSWMSQLALVGSCLSNKSFISTNVMVNNPVWWHSGNLPRLFPQGADSF